MTRGENLMRQWDAMRAAIAKGDRSSAPRDWFESVIDCRDERIAELEAALCGLLAYVDGTAMPYVSLDRAEPEPVATARKAIAMKPSE